MSFAAKTLSPAAKPLSFFAKTAAGRLRRIAAMPASHRLTLACALLLAAPAWAATFTVNTDFDTFGPGASDILPGDGLCATNGGNCTLRAAIEEANALPGHDTILFNVPPVGGSGVAYIRPRFGLPTITDTVTIDGGTQPGSTGGPGNSLPVLHPSAVVNLRLAGSDAGPHASGLVFAPGANTSTVRYLAIVDFEHAGVLVDGGYQSGAGALQGVRITDSFIGTDDSGLGDDADGSYANGVHGVHITAGASGTVVTHNLIVGHANGAAVTMSHGAPYTTVVENRIGTNRPGTQRKATQVGVLIEEGAHGATVQGNTIGAAQVGVLIRHGGGVQGAYGDGNVIVANRIGIGLGGQNIAGSEDGIHITNAARPTMPFNNAIGGIAQDWGNTIAHWGRNGVRISRLNDANGAPSPRNAILGNSIFGNGALGIELIDQTSIPPLGANPQDPPPPAINDGQHAPNITSALPGGGGVQLAYQLNGPPGQAYFIEVFTNTACDASGYGEGQTPLTRIDLADASGGQHTAQLQPLLPGTVLTLTATAQQGQVPTGGTSEFSRCLAVGQTAGGGNPQPGQPGVAPVPTLGHAALALLSALIGAAGWRRRKA